ncbi:MAG: pilus assembly PilX family protein [Telluria sp.]
MTSALSRFPRFLSRARGVGLVTAIFLLVVLAGLGVAMTTLFATQQSTAALDELGSRAYQAARAGIEWGIYQQNIKAQCSATSTTFTLPATATSLAGFSVTVSCKASTGAGGIQRWTITSVACNQPGSNGCPNPSNNPDYVSRKLEVIL